MATRSAWRLSVNLMRAAHADEPGPMPTNSARRHRHWRTFRSRTCSTEYWSTCAWRWRKCGAMGGFLEGEDFLYENLLGLTSRLGSESTPITRAACLGCGGHSHASSSRRGKMTSTQQNLPIALKYFDHQHCVANKFDGVSSCWCTPVAMPGNSC